MSCLWALLLLLPSQWIKIHLLRKTKTLGINIRIIIIKYLFSDSTITANRLLQPSQFSSLTFQIFYVIPWTGTHHSIVDLVYG